MCLQPGFFAFGKSPRPMCLVGDNRVFTGDTLLIGATGRA
jgi:hypothetical protein